MAPFLFPSAPSGRLLVLMGTLAWVRLLGPGFGWWEFTCGTGLAPARYNATVLQARLRSGRRLFSHSNHNRKATTPK